MTRRTLLSSTSYENGRLDVPYSSSFWKESYSFQELPELLKLHTQATPESPEGWNQDDMAVPAAARKVALRQ
jgi:hypothetical protein